MQDRSTSALGRVQSENRSNTSSMVILEQRQQKPTEPLIAKAYTAYRIMNSSDPYPDNLPTQVDEYQAALENPTAPQKQMIAEKSDENLLQQKSHKSLADNPSGVSLPQLAGATKDLLGSAELQIATEEDLIKNLQSGHLQEGAAQKGLNRLGNLVNTAKPASIRKAAVLDINRTASLPATATRRKNKNDFYRYLIQNNKERGQTKTGQQMIFNDVLIPRSILKKSIVPGSVKEQRLEQAAEEFYDYQVAMSKMKREDDEEYLGKYEIVFGQHLDVNDPQLSPKVKQLVKANAAVDKFLNSSPGTSPKVLLSTQPTQREPQADQEANKEDSDKEIVEQ